MKKGRLLITVLVLIELMACGLPEHYAAQEIRRQFDSLDQSLKNSDSIIFNSQASSLEIKIEQLNLSIQFKALNESRKKVRSAIDSIKLILEARYPAKQGD